MNLTPTMMTEYTKAGARITFCDCAVTILDMLEQSGLGISKKHKERIQQALDAIEVCDE